MLAKIRHIAAYTEHYDKVANFYKTVFGMKQITTGMVDESGKASPNRGHISDGVIGLALLARRPGLQSGLDHFGFEVESVKAIEESAQTTSEANIYGAVAENWIRDPEGNRVDITEHGWPI